ncbi:MAG: PepSY domain-containing protein [Pseudomonadota bacterium]
MKLTYLSVLMLAGFTQSANATGLHTCDSGAREHWKSADALAQKLGDGGWQVRKIKVDGGCYEVYGTTPEGQRGEAYFHPQTLELEIIARRGKVLYRNSD